MEPSEKIMSFSTNDLVVELQHIYDRKRRVHRKYVIIDKLRDMLEEVKKL